MPNDRYARSKTHINIGTIGEFGHGKTTLTAAIMKILSTRVERNTEVPFESINEAIQERENGSTIRISHLQYETDNRQYAHFDCPGQMDYVKYMIRGGAQMDAAILVIDATEGIGDQIKEHILLSSQIGAPYIVVFINKCDIVEDPDVLEIAEREIRELLNEYGYLEGDTPIIRGSALKALEDPTSQWGNKIMELMEAVDQWIPDPNHETDKHFLMPVDEVSAIWGRGVVAKGRVKRGVVCISREVEIIGMGAEYKKAMVTGIEKFGKFHEEAEAGDDAGVLLVGIQQLQPDKGYVVAEPGTIRCYKQFIARVYVLTREEGGRHTPLFNGFRAQFYFGAACVLGVCNLVQGAEMCMPGDSAEMAIELNTEIPMEREFCFAIRDGGRTIGVGKVIATG